MTVPDMVIGGRMYIDGEIKYAQAGITDGRFTSVGKHIDGDT